MAAAISPKDVLSGRGGATNNHPGNKRFRAIVADHMPEYLAARKKEKALIAKRIVDMIKREGGRFLKRSPDSDTWIEASDRNAVSKTSQALREGLDVRHKTYRPEKMARRDSESSEENPRKRTRLVKGKVVDSPRVVGANGYYASIPRGQREFMTVPDLRSEEYPRNAQSSDMDPLMSYFEPPRITKADCEDIAAV